MWMLGMVSKQHSSRHRISDAMIKAGKTVTGSTNLHGKYMVIIQGSVAEVQILNWTEYSKYLVDRLQ